MPTSRRRRAHDVEFPQKLRYELPFAHKQTHTGTFKHTQIFSMKGDGKMLPVPTLLSLISFHLSQAS